MSNQSNIFIIVKIIVNQPHWPKFVPGTFMKNLKIWQLFFLKKMLFLSHCSLCLLKATMITHLPGHLLNSSYLLNLPCPPE